MARNRAITTVRHGILAALLGAGIVAAASAQVTVQPQASPPPPPPPMTGVRPDLPCGGLHPIIATHTIPPYPDLSHKLSEQGSTTLTVTLDQQGVPTDVAVNTTSGWQRLDDAATIWVKDTWRWAPLDASCTAARTMVRITFAIRSDDAANSAFALAAAQAAFPPGAWDAREFGEVYLSISLGEHGDIARIAIMRTSGYADLDAQAMVLIRGHTFEPARMDGKPSSGPMLIRVLFPDPSAMPSAPPPSP